MDKNQIEQIQNILNLFNETKDTCSKLYKKLENARTKPECDELIKFYKDIVNNLKIIKEDSKALDNVEIPEDFVGTEEEINQARENNCKNLECLAQSIRGCIDSFKKYNEMIQKKKVEVQE